MCIRDRADNPGGGSPSDCTEILHLFVERELEEAALLHIVDRETVTKAQSVGVGNRGDFEIGGKLHELSGEPVKVNAEVVTLTDGKFIYDGPMFAKLEGDHGDSALLKAGGIYIAVISIPHQPIDLAFARSSGLDCTKMRTICLKSTGHFRSGFGPIAGSIFNVDAVAPLTQDFSKLPFKRLGRKIYPMDRDAEPGF